MEITIIGAIAAQAVQRQRRCPVCDALMPPAETAEDCGSPCSSCLDDSEAAKPGCSMIIIWDMDNDCLVVWYKLPNGEVVKVPKLPLLKFRKYIARKYGTHYILKFAPESMDPATF